MKLITFASGDDPHERLGAILPSGAVLDLSAELQAPPFLSMLSLIEAGPPAWERARTAVEGGRAEHVVRREDIRLCAPLPLPPQFRDSMSFHQHIVQSAQTRMRSQLASEVADEVRASLEHSIDTYELPSIYRRQPTYYKGNRFNVAGPDTDVVWPSYSRVMDFELELACVIGKGGCDIPKGEAHEHVFGYTIFNDLSARDAQMIEMDGRLGPAKGKDFDNGNVFGPCLVTADEIENPYSLRMQARVNGETWCDNNSSTMNWRFDDLIAHISRGETLYPGEIIGSGTVGNGCGLEHGRFLNSGDEIELEIEKIGILRTRVVHPEDTKEA